jgi:hypothetical protein
VGRGERLIKLGDGWFSTKAIVVALSRRPKEIRESGPCAVEHSLPNGW